MEEVKTSTWNTTSKASLDESRKNIAKQKLPEAVERPPGVSTLLVYESLTKPAPILKVVHVGRKAAYARSERIAVGCWS